MFCLFEWAQQTGLGLFKIRLNSSSAFSQVTSNGRETVISTAEHEVIVRCVQAPAEGLPSGMSVSSAHAWLFYVQKRNNAAESLEVSISLADAESALEADANTGQWLVAVEFEDGQHQVHVGTQDEELYAGRAGSLWMPKRLESDLANHRLIITDITAKGLLTRVPSLFAKEQFYFHYILAESPRRKSIDYPHEWDVSTWYAVDQSQDKLEKAWLKSLHS